MYLPQAQSSRFSLRPSKKLQDLKQFPKKTQSKPQPRDPTQKTRELGLKDHACKDLCKETLDLEERVWEGTRSPNEIQPRELKRETRS